MFYAFKNPYGIRTANAAEEFFAFKTKKARDEWVSANELDFRGNVIAAQCSAKYVYENLTQDVRARWLDAVCKAEPNEIVSSCKF